MTLVLPPCHVTKWTLHPRETVGSFRAFRVDRTPATAPGQTDPRDFYTFVCPDWCNVIAITEGSELLLIWQYRIGDDTLSLELPGGIVDAGESPHDAAIRELREETGYAARAITPLLTFSPNPALQNNRAHSFVAHGAYRAGEPAFDADEHCELVSVPVERIPELLDAGYVHHALMVAALESYLRRFPKGR